MGVISAEALLTVEEAREIAALNPGTKYELHYGQLVEVTQPKYNHQLIQRQIFRLLSSSLGNFGEVFMECAYRGTPEYDARSAEIGVISIERHRQAVALNEFFGAPDLVIEIISPSNRAGEMDDKEAFYLAHGCQSFWLVNPVRRTVKVTDVTRHVQWFKEGDQISLAPFAPGSVTVNQIFAPLTEGKSGI